MTWCWKSTLTNKFSEKVFYVLYSNLSLEVEGCNVFKERLLTWSRNVNPFQYPINIFAATAASQLT